jgi:hypothetical protein
MENFIGAEKYFIVTREYLTSLLEAWRNDRITAKQLHDCIGSLYEERSVFLDEEGEEENSVCCEVIASLEMMDIDYTCKDDIDAYIEFLKTPIGQFKEGVKNFYSYTDSVDREERMKKLYNIAPYNYGESYTVVYENSHSETIEDFKKLIRSKYGIEIKDEDIRNMRLSKFLSYLGKRKKHLNFWQRLQCKA